jgi:DNA-binding NtrC family response regulator
VNPPEKLDEANETVPSDLDHHDPGQPSCCRVLIVDDEPEIRTVLEDILKEPGHIVRSASDGAEALRALDEDHYDLVLLDLNLPRVSGINVLTAARPLQPTAQFIMMTAFGSVESAVEAMKLGAFEYIRKPFSPDELMLVVRRALDEAELRREVAQLRRQTSNTTEHGIVGKSAAIRRMFDLIERVAPTRATVLITGETGTGKELVAQAIHRFSPRSRRPFIPVTCSALPETLLESELFGHKKGSFTGATHNKAGLFEEAAGGTLFLDEIGTISPSIQVKLLRVLQERRIKRIGGAREIPVDFRLVAASNQDLGELEQSPDFREDLLYRLNVFPIHVPPLRERTDDIPRLANHFRQLFGEENGIEAPGISPTTMARLMAYPWPGNVRELENFIERSVIMYAGAETMPLDELGPAGKPAAGDNLLKRAQEAQWDLERLEREYIVATLERTRWNQGSAAELLGINRRTLYRKLNRYREEGHLASADSASS